MRTLRLMPIALLFLCLTSTAMALPAMNYTIVIINNDTLTYGCNTLAAKPDTWPGSGVDPINVLPDGQYTEITCPNCSVKADQNGFGARGGYFCEAVPGGPTLPSLGFIANWYFNSGQPAADTICQLTNRPGYKCTSSHMGRQIKLVIEKDG